MSVGNEPFLDQERKRARETARWRLATVMELRVENGHAKTIVLGVPGWPRHLAGQHVDLRLTAEDGYQAQRSYSIASPPEEALVEITVDRIAEGEVSPFLNDELLVGDEIELRGPFGGYFNWQADDGGPVLLVGGGSGLVPLMAMLRHRRAAGSNAEMHLLLSARSADDVLYEADLHNVGALQDITVVKTFTRQAPEGWVGFARRVDSEMLGRVAPPIERKPKTYICGPTPFVEQVANILVDLGYPSASIRTERFGPSG
jgi:ferredoxin-NADP reductase